MSTPLTQGKHQHCANLAIMCLIAKHSSLGIAHPAALLPNLQPGICLAGSHHNPAACLMSRRDIRFSRPEHLDPKVVAVIGSNNDGWQHYCIDLAELAPEGTGIAKSGSFDRIIVTDVSGMGFNLLLDDVQLLTGLKNFRAAEGWLGGAAWEGNFAQAGAMPPVYGDDLVKVGVFSVL
jgi:hypothetical protein